MTDYDLKRSWKEIKRKCEYIFKIVKDERPTDHDDLLDFMKKHFRQKQETPAATSEKLSTTSQKSDKLPSGSDKLSSTDDQQPEVEGFDSKKCEYQKNHTIDDEFQSQQECGYRSASAKAFLSNFITNDDKLTGMLTLCDKLRNFKMQKDLQKKV